METLADYLRARRTLVEPIDVGLPAGSRQRRVAGLRREEVAMLAGISSDYYLRLEQGRELHPSLPVLNGLALALRLDQAAVAHLHRLARPYLGERRQLDDTVSVSVRTLVEQMPAIPAYVLNRYLDILYVNALGRALSADFRPGNNLAKLVFFATSIHDKTWRATARRTAAYLRSSVDPTDDGPEITSLLENLHAGGAEFTEIWSRHETLSAWGTPTTFSHPEVGPIELRYQTFDLPATGGQMLGMFVPAPGGPSAECLQMLMLFTRDPANTEGVPITPRNTGTTPPQVAALYRRSMSKNQQHLDSAGTTWTSA
ncbi:XRE family transcriptional regulator [Cryobacterium adonitolivorans]|uniref:XRE family transcriptional regulator n=1 Tax=Cryobacterium adonitolivorans TaxID=1259189 RepID=A0A4R8W2J3_9MICO|nr:helix-turn-helix transcriptional regulator [Cryobacterium adonitolivorans]TFC01035.1 XRE family transcriptional regulator [Cryobacterium adonitolivorans]